MLHFSIVNSNRDRFLSEFLNHFFQFIEHRASHFDWTNENPKLTKHFICNTYLMLATKIMTSFRKTIYVK